MSDPIRDPIPPLARDVVDLYRDALSDVRFPDVDRPALDEAERALLEAQCALEDAEAALESARQAVSERSAALALKVQRALAYARVFAEDDPALRERVAAIAAGRTSARPRDESTPIKRRGRSRKGNANAASLFEAPEPDAVDLAS